MMEFYMTHGRTDPDGGPQQLNHDTGEATYVDDWGFDGPRIKGVVGFHSTYGTEGYWNLYFKSEMAAEVAKRITGWERWDDHALTVDFSPDGSLVRMWDRRWKRYHYFGDWGLA